MKETSWTTMFIKNRVLLQTKIGIGVMAQRHMSQFLTETLELTYFLAGSSVPGLELLSEFTTKKDAA